MRIDRQSLSTRLVLSISLMLVVFWALGVGLAIHVMRGEFDEVFDSALRETTERLAPLVVDDYFRRDAGNGPHQIADLRSGGADEYLTYQVRDATGRVLLHSDNTNADPYPVPLESGFWNDDKRRIFTVATVSNSVFVQVADSLDHRREATLESALALLMPILLLLPLGMFATGWIVVRATRPIGQLRRAISERDGANLQPIILPGLPTEIATIPNSVNTLLERLKLALQAERDLAANSAHELRTPLAGALAHTELLAGQLDRKADKLRAERVLEALRRLSRMLEKLLQLSRAEAGIGVADTPVDLFALVEMVVSEFRQANPAASVEMIGREERLPFARKIDPDAFAIAFKNLLENAARYGSPGKPIIVMLSVDGRITVSNRVDHTLEPDVDVYRQRFKRGGALVPGSGLGLAIVDKLVQQMNGRLALRSAATDQGVAVFEAELDFSSGSGGRTSAK